MKKAIDKAIKILFMKPFWNDNRKLCVARTVISVVFAAVSALLLSEDLKSGSKAMAISSIVLVVGFLFSAVVAGVFKKPAISGFIIALLAAFVLTGYAIVGGNQGFSILWILVVPMFAMNILGIHSGFLLSFYFLVFLPVLFYTPLNSIIEGKYNEAFLERFPILYTSVFIIATFLSLQKEYYNKKVNVFLYLDSLTGVYTRQYFFMRAEELLISNPNIQYDVQISDIVDFKKINELYGVSEGDAVLKWTANFFSKNIGNKCLVGRYGGDQFIIMAPHESMKNEIEPVIFEDFARDMQESDIINCEIKFGLYENIPHDKSIVSSCDKAHIALNSIKNMYGKERAVYDSSMESKVDVQRKIESSMRQALKEKQFKVFYQPKHNPVTGELVGAEALIRWIHPEFGFMSPGDFIPLFEKNGFIVETDYYVWERTCQNIKRWQDMGLKTIPISVNASKMVFEQQDLLEKTKQTVLDAGISADYLHFEVTETMMSEDIDALVEILAALRNQGFKIELDDFGSGFTSMNILSSLPLDIVKLDMSFMKQFGNEKRKKVQAACIKLAKELGYKTVQEGVELKEQVEKLSEMGVDYIQGYYYSKPLSEEEFELYMKSCQEKQ